MSGTLREVVFATTVTLCLGMADCGLSATQATYRVSPCFSKSFELPQSVKSETFEATREQLKGEASSASQCSKLIHYRVRQRVYKHILLSKIEWQEYDAYVGIVQGDGCHVLVSSKWLGPPVTESQVNDGMKWWAAANKIFLDLILKSSGKIPESTAEKIELTKGKESYKKWCDELLLSELRLK